MTNLIPENNVNIGATAGDAGTGVGGVDGVDAVESAEAEARPSAQYLSIAVSDQSYGVPIAAVVEVISNVPLTRIPKVPKFISGVINLRGKIIPVADIKMKFKMGTCLDTDRTCIAVLQLPDDAGMFGILVEDIPQVVDVPLSELDNHMSVGDGEDMKYIRSIARCEGHIVLLLKLEKLFDAQELQLAPRGDAADNISASSDTAAQGNSAVDT
ncbi:MAG: purine-binding chemotaxis protein CheW [Planctomycetes bacterium]|nr:purine-binding chemotaxis protein CheW [Planctomycetota bacterium]